MPEKRDFLAAVERLAARLPGRAQVHSLAVGRNNGLQGQATWIDSGSHRVLFLFSGDYYAHQAFSVPQTEYVFSSGTRFDPAMDGDWDGWFWEVEEQLERLTEVPSKRLPATTPLPESSYSILSAAIAGRLQVWNPSRVFLNPRVAQDPWDYFDWERWREWRPDLSADLEQLQDSGCYRLESARLQLPWPVSMVAAEQDPLQFYADYPDAHGRLSLAPPRLSADGRQAALMATHSLGFRLAKGISRGQLPGSGPRPDTFKELLVLDRQGTDWRLTAQLPQDIASPPALVQARELQRIQTELGDWGQVLSVVTREDDAIEAQLNTPRGPRRVLLARELMDYQADPVWYPEPTLWIFSSKITGAAIRQASGAPGV